MSSPETVFFPGALDLSYMQRVEEAVTIAQFKRLEKGFNKTGVIAALGESALQAPWSAYMDMMDGIDSAHAAVYEDRPDNVSLFVRFKDFDPDETADPYSAVDPRDSFDQVTKHLLAGVHGEYMPHVRRLDEDDRMLRIFNYTYADVSTAGRVGTLLLRKEFLPVMGRQNLWVVQTASLGKLREQGIVSKLPDTLQARIEGFYERHGALADSLLLSSGNLGIIGREMRAALGSAVPLAIQRPRGNRPLFEKDVSFKAQAQGSVPISTNKLGHTLWDQAVERWYTFIAPIRQREVDGGKNIFDLLSSLGATEGGAALVRALGTIIAANGTAIKRTITDKRHRH